MFAISRTVPAAICISALLLGLVGCGTEEGSPQPVPGEDAGVTASPDAGFVPMPELLLGTGETTFAPVAEGQVLPLVHGFQGLQHVWVSLRAREFSPDRAIIALSLDRVRDGRPATDAMRVRIPLFLDPEGAYVERLGIQLVVQEPSLVLGEQLVLTAGIDNPLGAHATVSAHITVVWEENL